jgi:hypothetical protein
MNPRRNLIQRQPNRRGSIYLFALSACGLVVVAGVTAVRIARVNLSSQATARDADLASREADAAMNLLAEIVTNDPSGVVWRADSRYYANITELTGPDNTGEAARIRIECNDPVDADLRDDVSERFRATITATVDEVQRTREFELEPVLANLSCLSHTLIYGSVSVREGKSFQFGGTQANVVGGSRSPTVLNTAAVKRSTRVDVSSTDTVTSSADLFLPNYDSILTAFRNRGATEVSLSADLSLDKELISPNRFSLGTTNAQGLYIINANGHHVVIQNTRIAASVIIYNVDKTLGVHIESSVTMEPAFPGFPTLVVGGNVEMAQASADLTEADAARNLNPTGATYLGSTDTDTLDAYPSIISGLVYVDGNLTVSGRATIHGQLFVSGSLSVQEQLIVRSDPVETTSPVLGFSMPTGMRLVTASVSGN